MKVIVNVSALTPPLTGIGRYTYNMLRELMEHPQITDLKGLSAEGLLSKADLKKKLDQLGDSNTPKPRLLHQACTKLPGARQAWRLMAFIQALRYRRQFMQWAYWEPGFTLLPLGAPCVATLYDLSHIRYPNHHPWYRVKLLDLAIPRTLARTRRILTISDFTRSELTALLGPKQPIDIAYPGIDCAFFNVTADDIEQCRKKLALPQHYILSVGTLEPRKNLAGLIHAFQALPEALRLQYPLLIAGAKGWHDRSINDAIAQLVAQGEARMLGYVEQQDVPALYAAATVTAYVSHYEGFGMPVAESMAAGTPVLTSSVSSMPEVAAGSALTANPADIGDITHKLELLLNNSELRFTMAAAGRERARTFTWRQAADTLVSSLQQAHSQH